MEMLFLARDAGVSFDYSIQGTSMLPAFKDGTRVRVAPSPSYEVGDAIVFRFEGRLTCHRIIERGQDGRFRTRGDNNPEADGPWTPVEDILGKAELFPAIEAVGLKKFFARRMVVALDGVDLTVAQGKVVALLGPNGAGKTTLIKVLAGMVLPDAGSARVFGHDVERDRRHALASVGLAVGEERSFYWRLTGRQNLEFFAALYGLPVKTARRKVEACAERMQVADLDRRFQEYSTGNKLRLALARSFLSDARLLFMDEPTKSLDPSAASRLRSLIKDLSRREGRTVFFATHDTHDAEETADRIAILDRGRLRGVGTLEELRQRAGGPSGGLDDIYDRLTRA